MPSRGSGAACFEGARNRGSGLGHRVNRLLVDTDSPNSLSGRARRRRWEALASRFPELSEMRVIDLGGTVRSWKFSGLRPAEVMLLNTFDQNSDLPWVKSVVGDACEVPEQLRGERFDLVFSNSVLEHVGGHRRRVAFAECVHQFGHHHWIQTPYRYFPIEPHWLFPGFQFLPLRAQSYVTMRWPLLTHPPATTDQAVRRNLGNELMSRTHMRFYFPTSEIHEERIAGVPKSLVAVR